MQNSVFKREREKHRDRERIAETFTENTSGGDTPTLLSFRMRFGSSLRKLLRQSFLTRSQTRGIPARLAKPIAIRHGALAFSVVSENIRESLR